MTGPDLLVAGLLVKTPGFHRALCKSQCLRKQMHRQGSQGSNALHGPTNTQWVLLSLEILYVIYENNRINNSVPLYFTVQTILKP